MTRQHHCTNCLALPAFLLAISGPFLTVYGAIFLDTLAAEPLTEALWMVPWKHMQAKSTSLVHSVDGWESSTRTTKRVPHLRTLTALVKGDITHVAQGPSDLCLLGLGQQDSVLCRQVHGPVLQRGSWSTANAECVVSSLFYCRFEKRRGWCAWFHSASMKTKKQGGCSRIREGSGEMTCAITTLFWIQGDGLTWSTFEGR